MPREEYYIEMMQRPWTEYTKEFRHEILKRRIEITTACRDSDHLPRVEDAGACRVNDKGFAVQRMHNGLDVLYGRYYGPWMNEIIASLRGAHEPQEEAVFAELLKHIPTGGVMVEAGCYWGYYSMWFAREIEEARVYLVEPQPNQMKVARANFEINDLAGDFTVGYFGSYPEKKKRIQEKRIEDELPRYTVREFMDEKKLDRISILHSDIQGHEQEMLENAHQELADRLIDYLVISTHGSRHQACRKLLVAEGYRIVCEHAVGESASVDGLLVAQNPGLPANPEIRISKVEGLVTAHG